MGFDVAAMMSVVTAMMIDVSAMMKKGSAVKKKGSAVKIRIMTVKYTVVAKPVEDMRKRLAFSTGAKRGRIKGIKKAAGEAALVFI